MIRSWGKSATRRLFETGRSRFRGLDVDAALDLHSLKGGRKGQWVHTVNGPWRICFRFKDGDAHEVEIVDYH